MTAGALAALSLAACGPRSPTPSAADDAQGEEQAYMIAPQVDGVRGGLGGVTLLGSAPAQGQVQLATPAGQVLVTTADARGRWAIALPPEIAGPRIFGLSVTVKGRKAQAEGYVLVTPNGQAALLRAGSGAQRIDPAPRPGIRAIDFDRGGGMEVSVQAPPGAMVILRLDGRQAAEGRADTVGRYEASLGAGAPVGPGVHGLQVSGDRFTDETQALISPGAPLAQGPLRSQLTPAGLRVDWMTPGGGVQSTLLIH